MGGLIQLVGLRIVGVLLLSFSGSLYAYVSEEGDGDDCCLGDGCRAALNSRNCLQDDELLQFNVIKGPKGWQAGDIQPL